MKTRIVALALALCFVAFSFVACGPKVELPSLTVSVVLTDATGAEVLNENVTFQSDAPTLQLALEAACELAEIQFEVTSYGSVEQIGEIVLGEKDYWAFKVNDADATGISVQTVADGDKITGTIGTIVDAE